MSGGVSCKCGNRRGWYVSQRYCNHSAFNGYHHTRSDYSTLICRNCRAVWRTKAAYVSSIPDATAEDRK